MSQQVTLGGIETAQLDLGLRTLTGVRSPAAIWRTVAGLIAAALILGGCGVSRTDSEPDPDPGAVSHANRRVVESDETPKLGGKIVYGLWTETNGWNPATNQWAASGLIVAHTIFDTLAAYDEQAQAHPFLAEAFNHDADYTHWTIKLRPGITFQNGKPANATAVARGLNYLKSSAVTGQAFYVVDTITAVDDLTIAVKTVGTWVSFPLLLSTQVGVVADPDWLESNDGLHPVGTGPFRLETWDIGNQLVVQRNRSYWQKDSFGATYPYLDTVEFRVIPDSTTRSDALHSGDIDVMQQSDGRDIVAYQKENNFQVISDAKGETPERFILLNTMKPPFDDVDARRALAYATDTEQFSQVSFGGYNEAANGPFSPNSPWYADSGYPKYDLAKAKQLVADVKGRHKGKFEFTVTSSNDVVVHEELVLLQSQWEEAGITVHVEVNETKRMIINVVTGSYEATVWLQFDSPQPLIDSVYVEPANATVPPAFSLNFARNADPEIGVALERGRHAVDDASMKDALTTVQKRLTADVPYIWLDHEHAAIIATDRLVNLTRYKLPDGAVGLNLVQGSHPLYQVWLR